MAPALTPTPIPALAPVERPSLWFSVLELSPSVALSVVGVALGLEVVVVVVVDVDVEVEVVVEVVVEELSDLGRRLNLAEEISS